MKKLYFIIIGALLISLGIGQYVFVSINKSKLIWDQYCDQYHMIGGDDVTLPKTPHNYLLVLSVYHGAMGQDYTQVDVTLTHIESSDTSDYRLIAQSGTYQGWFHDSAILNLPSGDYHISWESIYPSGFILKLYINGLFNENGDYYFNTEKMISLGSGIILFWLLIFGLVSIGYAVYGLIKSRSKSRSSINEVKKKVPKKIIERKEPDSFIPKESNIMKTIIEQALIRSVLEFESQKIKTPPTVCPNCGSIVQISKEKKCTVCGFKIR